MNELISIGQAEVGGAEVNTVSARELHGFLGSKRQFSNWITYQIEAFGFVEDADFITINNFEYSPPRKEYYLTIDMAKELSMVERNAKGKEARLYFIECERLAKQAPSHNLPTTFSEALRLLANEVEMKELAMKQRDEAIRTKAWISDSKTATAMATASAAVRKQRQLENELGKGRDFKCAKSIPWVLSYFADSKGMWSALGKKLAMLSIELGYQVDKIDSKEFGHINAYHVDVIEQFRKRLDADWNMLGKFRRMESAE